MSKVFSLKHVNDLLNDPAYRWLVPASWSFRTVKATGHRYINLPSETFLEKNCVFVKLNDNQSFFHLKEWCEHNLSNHVILDTIDRPYHYHYFCKGTRHDEVDWRRFMQLWFENEHDRLLFIMRFPEYALTEIPEKEPKYADFEGQEIDKTYTKPTKNKVFAAK